MTSTASTTTSSLQPVSSTVADLIRRSADRFGSRTAVEFGDRTWSYAEFDSAVTAIARELRRLGAGPGDRIAAYGRNSDLYALVYLACARAGFIHVPVNFQLTGDELDYILANSGAGIVVADSDLAEAVSATAHGGSARLVGFDDFLGPASAPDIAPAGEGEFDVADTDVAQLLYTSGTTSAPKGAVMTHRALVHEYLSCLTSLDFAGTDRVVHALPLYHSAQMHVFLLPLLAVGAHNIIVTAPVPDDLLALFESRRINSFFAAPTVWVALANSPGLETRNLDSLEKAYYGASIMPGAVLEKLRTRLPGLGFYNCFGQSEMGPLCTVLRPEEHDAHPGSAGRAVLFVETRVVDAAGEEVGPGELGEILYRSPQLCEGYWDRPEATDAAFDGQWFHSGDLVRMDADGYVEVVDRVKDVINTGGVLVASRQVEDAIFAMPGVAEVAVVGIADEKWIEAISAFVVLRDDAGEIAEADVIAHVRDRLAGFKVPKRVTFVAELPKNSAGKILKRSLRET
ncbi:fatty acyl-CoA synthetase [Brevibacterium casei]|uniref:AMP-binding protein n=1 Tax=Brevibacterium casei TaxID=33889 RepID=A0A7T3ZXJ7_9MICO|nr:fatty acyl-CoA synthetase [Brevibacterium casei]QQB13529.1 AMP-binding protein [Brevibacterium casei]